jgi:hypothetical protein
MIQITAEASLWEAARMHLDARAENVAFFLADWSAPDRELAIRAWRAVDAGPADPDGHLHVSLPDETLAMVIQWACAEGACLIEAHSHGSWSPAAFSGYDLRNLVEWVPHLRWRLQRRPYAAIVTSHRDLDALAWIDDPRAAEQVDGITAGAYFPATKATRSFCWKDEDGREPV